MLISYQGPAFAPIGFQSRFINSTSAPRPAVTRHDCLRAAGLAIPRFTHSRTVWTGRVRAVATVSQRGDCQGAIWRTIRSRPAVVSSDTFVVHPGTPVIRLSIVWSADPPPAGVTGDAAVRIPGRAAA